MKKTFLLLMTMAFLIGITRTAHSQNTKEDYVDLGLRSGTLWKSQNEEGFYTYEDAINEFGGKLPTKELFDELKSDCQWTWTGNGYRVTGPNGNSIVLPALGFHKHKGDVNNMGEVGFYWSSKRLNGSAAWSLYFKSGKVAIYMGGLFDGLSVRLVKSETAMMEGQARKEAEQKRKAEKEERKAELKAMGYVDLGLSSGTWWKNQNEEGLYSWEEAYKKFGKEIPTREQFVELKSTCHWTRTENGYKVTGPNGNSIILPALGERDCKKGIVDWIGSMGAYWSQSEVYYDDFKGVFSLRFYMKNGKVMIDKDYWGCYGFSIRLVNK